MLDVQRLVAECEDAAAHGGGQRQVHELIARAVAAPGEVLAALGEPAGPGVQVLHRSPRLTILNLVWYPHAVTRPHDHRMWAVIGMYAGREDNIFWRRLPEDGGSRVEAAGARTLLPGEAFPLGKDIVHSVLNPLGKLTAALHVYGGDFIEAERSEWNDESLREQPYDHARLRGGFAEGQAAWARRQAGGSRGSGRLAGLRCVAPMVDLETLCW